MRTTNTRRAHGALLVLAACAASPCTAQELPDSPDALRFAGNVVLRFGWQEANDASIYPPEGSTDSLSLVSRRANTVLRLTQPGSYSVMFDGEYEDRPHAGPGGAERNRINQFYVNLDVTDSFKLRIGKQRVLWGRGFTYIPTDFINPPLDPSGLDLAKVGVKAISADWIGETLAVSGIVRNEKGGKVDSAGLKVASSAVSGLDLDLILYHAPSVGNAVGTSFAIDASQLVSEKLNGLVVHGGASVHRRSRYPTMLPGDGGVLVPGELGARGRYFSWLVGAAYEFNDRFTLNGELYHIGDAYRPDQYDSVLGALLAQGTPAQAASAGWFPHLAFGRNQRRYATLQGSLSGLTDGRGRFTDNLALELGTLTGLDDNSRLYTFSVQSGYWDSVEVTWRNFVPTGRRRSEFGAAPYEWYTELSFKIGF